MERVHVDERGLFDPSQGREAPASEASDSPRFRWPRLSSLEEGETLMLRRPVEPAPRNQTSAGADGWRSAKEIAAALRAE